MKESKSLWSNEDLALLRRRGSKFFVKRAMQGFADAQYLLGLMMYTGMHLEQDFAEAHKMFVLSAHSGNRNGAFLAASMWCKNEVPPSMGDPIEQAVKYFRMAANKNHVQAACALGNLRTQEKIRETEKPPEKDSWFNFFKKKNPSTKNPLSGITDEEAVGYYQIGIDAKYTTAYYFMAIHYLNGWGVEINHDHAVKLLMDATAQGDKDSMWLLASILEEKKGLDSESLMLYEEAADKGHPAAQHLIGVAYYDGKVLEKNIDQAKIMLHRAAAQNFTPAQSFLSDVYYLERNYLRSYEWGSRAARRNAFDKKELSRILNKMTASEREKVPGIEAANDEFDEIVQKMLSIPE